MSGDFPEAEFAARTERAQAAMAAQGFDALLFTTEAEVRYFSGFRTLFWQSPTRPWFLTVPARGKPIAVIPEIGAAPMRLTWLDDVRSWSSPHPDDEGITLLTDALSGAARVGMPMGRESALRMPLNDLRQLREALPGTAFADATPLVTALRRIKSEAEIAVTAEICAAASRAFAQAPALFRSGQPLDDAFRAFKIALLNEGAEDVPYLVGGCGPDGYADVISPPTAQPIGEGDVLMLDTGATLRGYYCDFCRNWAFGTASDAAKRAYATLYAATEAGLEAARPGATAGDLFRAMAAVIGQGSGDVGRFGHGLGLQLTEPPSNIGFDDTVLEPGMVLTLEPGMAVRDGVIMVHEENLVIREGRPQLLTERAPPELPVL
jgi:Xaa-Pro aminopeptidase